MFLTDLGSRSKINSHSVCRLCLAACLGTSRESLGGHKPKNLKQSGEEGGKVTPQALQLRPQTPKHPKKLQLIATTAAPGIRIQGSVLPTNNIHRKIKGKKSPKSLQYLGTKKGPTNNCSCSPPPGKQTLRS